MNRKALEKLLDSRGIKSSPTRTPRARKPTHARFAPGTIVCEGVILGRAVPWKAPTLGRNGGARRTPDYRRFIDWRARVAAQSRRQFGSLRPYDGPVRLDTTFYLRPAPGRPPDTDNLRKSFADALETIVFLNDTQVAGGTLWREIDPDQPERVEFRVIAI